MEKHSRLLLLLLNSIRFSDIRLIFRRAGILLFLFLFQLICIGNYATAQQVSITGTVTDQKGGPLPGVTVQVKGSSSGTLTDDKGKYNLANVPSGATLSFSFIGMSAQEIPVNGKTSIDVTLAEASVGLDEVVVTAIGIRREKKALGYAVQDIAGDVVQKAAAPTIVSGLSGKSAGVYINSSNGNVGSSSRILIRGSNSIKGNTQPLFVVDGIPIDNSIQSSSKGNYDFTDMGNAASDINPADVASVTILKGGSAAALYGSRGANGVVLITTKSGTGKGFKVEVESSTTFTNPLILPDYQNEYGQGGQEKFWYKDGLNGGKNDGVDESFGPRLDYVIKPEDIVPGGKMYWAVEAGFPQTAGQILMLPQFTSPVDPVTGQRTPTPWISHPDNVKNFFETGTELLNSVSLSNAGAWGNMRLALTNSNQKGMVPNTDMNKNTFSFSGNTSLTDKLSVDAKISYTGMKGNMNGTGYTFNNVMMQTVWAARQVDWEYEKTHYKNVDGTPISWINRWHDNPYWMQYENKNPMTKNRLIGSGTVTYKFNDWLSMFGRIGTDYSNQTVEMIRAYYALNSKEGSYQVENVFRQETNADFLVTARKAISENLTISGNFGGNIMNKKYASQGSNVGRLVVPNVYAIANAKDPATTTYYTSEKEIHSLYGSVSIDFRRQLYLEATGRNDWSSTLPADNNSYFYPSATASWIFSETFKLNPALFSFGKIRYGIANVGNDTDPYMLSMSYVASPPYQSFPSFKPSSTLPPQNLVNELITSNELGFDLRFFSNRLGLDLTLYKSAARNQIMNAVISNTSGFSAQTINAGRINNKGIEIVLTGTPVQTTDFSWDITWNWSKNKSEIIELYGDIKSITIFTTYSGVDVVAPIDGAYGTMMATDFVYHDNGKPMVDENGVPLRSDVKAVGNIMPDWMSGINNNFRYKSLSFSFLIDAKMGGDIFSQTNSDGFATGVLKSTTGNNPKGNPVRDLVEDGGGYLFDGVFEDGTKNDKYLYLDDFRWTGFPTSQWIYDASYVKLREVALSYTLPKKLISKIHLTNAELSVYGRNLAILYSNLPNVDPEVSGRDASLAQQGYEFGSNPSARSTGFRVKLTF